MFILGLMRCYLLMYRVVQQYQVQYVRSVSCTRI